MNCSWSDGLRLLVRGNSGEEALPGREKESELSVWSGNQLRSSTRIDGGDDDDAAHRQALKGNKGRSKRKDLQVYWLIKCYLRACGKNCDAPEELQRLRWDRSCILEADGGGDGGILTQCDGGGRGEQLTAVNWSSLTILQRP